MILVVEDNKIDQFLARKIISLVIGEKPHIVGNGKEALVWLEKNYQKKPILILLDIRMPVMNGLELLDILEASGEDFSELKVVMLSSSIDEEDYKNAMLSDYVKSFIHKPLKKSDFQEIVEDHDFLNT